MIPHAESMLLAVIMCLVTWASDKIVRMWYQILQADMVFTEDPVEKVIAETSDDLLPIRATKMPRLRRGESWEPRFQ